MAQSKITLIGCYNYFDSMQDDLFKYLILPSGIDKETLVNNILMNGGEFELLFSNPDFFQDMIKIWSNKWLHTFNKWQTAINIKYDPLYNYDRIEEYDDTRSEKEGINKNESVTAHDSSISSGTGETTNTKSAYDSTSYTPHDKSNSSSSGDNTSDSNTNVSGNQNRDRTETLKHKAHLYGNIGVTTSQQMLHDELDIAQWNIYEHITDLFLEEFTIYTY